MIEISDNKYSPDFKNTNCNKDLVAIIRKLRIIRTWIGVMISATGLYLAAYNIAHCCDGQISPIVFYFVFLICLGVIVLGGWVIFLANNRYKR